MAAAPPVWTVFSGTGQRTSSAFAALTPKRADTTAAAAAAAPPPPPDLDAIAAAARAEGYREGEAAAREAAAADAAAEREAAAAALAEARQRWVEAESAVLASAIADQARALEERLAESLTRVLHPFLTAALRQEAIRDLHATLASLVADDQAGTLAVTGPADLSEALAQRLDLPPGRIAVTTHGGPDLRVRLNGTLVETRLGAWGERIAALVEEG
ncbi:hypothetical protein SAMN05216360_10868 [Methylobacterium phyllostachyos]|uniref:Flagellar assembly protein FliH n=1 Tax=Methylobacterium phyllostachyos TaxID=582672 RepID=A0A1H0B6U8_9HYPH|nr:hypothetical protein [Methylobacterium phyllostachyos]SDN41390.1 hypothetical protein SAMN05216360_10868 [Methylobacterium phyllostachyos]